MDAGTADDGAVRVAVRVRPLIGREKVDRCDECVSVVDQDTQVVIGKNRSFTYDYVFGQYAQQRDVWSCVEPLVDAAFEGYNATIFAYGQTGSGKTFTMGSGSTVHLPPEDHGIIPRVISYMFDQIQSKVSSTPEYSAELRVRFLEIYGEDIRDLLVHLESTGEGKVGLREGEGGEIQVSGAAEEVVTDADDCLKLLERGTLSRTTGSTLMNAHSSRSHAIFTITMTQQTPLVGGEEQSSGEVEFETRTSCFNFVDLAGSERQKRTQAEGKRLKEGIEINKGLLALGNVISALGDEKKRGKVHVPYRDSKLTRMLQDSLGGNSRTLMLTCVSPADVNFEESLNALKYANRARNIKNKAVVNRDEASAANAALRRQVQALQEEVMRLRHPGMSDAELHALAPSTSNVGSGADVDSFASLRNRAENAESEVTRLTSEMKRIKTQMDQVREESIAAQAERDYLRSVVAPEQRGGEEEEAGKSLVSEHLKTIYDLQEKLRVAESENERVQMDFSSMDVPSYLDTSGKDTDELIARAEQEIADESAELEGQDADESFVQEEEDHERVFLKRQEHLGESVRDLSQDISVKEQLVQNLRAQQESYDKLRTFYENKMAQMVEQVKSAQQDREKLLQEMQMLEGKSKKDVESSSRLTKLTKELKTKDEQLSTLRRKQSEMQKFMAQKKKSETQLRALEAEVTSMKRQKVELMRKMSAERKKYEDEAKRRQREIAALKRAQRKDQQQIQRLGNEKSAQERVLRRKMEEANAAKQRLKQQQHLQAQAKRMNAKVGRTIQSQRKEVDMKWVEEEVETRAREQQKLEQLRTEREELGRELEELYLLHEDDPSADVDERIEACQAQLEYKEEQISSTEDSGIPDARIDRTKSLEDAKAVMHRLFSSAVNARKQAQSQEQHAGKMVLELKEAQEQLEVERSRATQLKQEYEQSLHRFVQTGLESDASGNGEDRSQHLLSVSEERNDVLKKKFEEQVERAKEAERVREALYDQMMLEQRQLRACQDEVQHLKDQVKRLSSKSNQRQERSRPVSWANELEEDESDDADGRSDEGSVAMDDKGESPTHHSDDGSTQKSIFSRLANPSNFTGIHKNRAKDSVSKREVLQSRADKNRQRRMKDRGGRGPGTSRLAERPASTSKASVKKPTQMMEVLENMRRENEGEAHVSDTVAQRLAQGYVTTTRPDDMEMPPPAPSSTPGRSRLAGTQFHRRPAPQPKSSSAGEEEAYMFDEGEDPLVHGPRLVDQVRDDYRQRLAETRSTRNARSRG